MEAIYLAALVCCILQSSRAFNIDTRQPIFRTLPSTSQADNENGLFGYTLVLHQVADVAPKNRAQALSNTRIVVSAPNLTVPNSAVDNTGAVFTCPVEMGSCNELAGDGEGADRRLFDRDPNSPNEVKSGQFLGGSMASIEDGFIVCANRYAEEFPGFIADTPLPIGRCFATSNQALRDFQQLQLCPVGNDGFGNAGICVSGTSSAVTVDQDDYTFSIGAPGYFGLRGVMIRVTPTGTIGRMTFGEGTSRDSYQGYAIAAGRFLERDVQDYAVSVPKLENYFGRVNIVTDATLSVLQPDLRGMQLGEYYGFSLLAANIQGDEFDELLVGAPMFRANATEPETGRVYVYNNVGGSLSLSRIIEGFDSFSRFGHAMANLGDINGDGLDDVAISAPFTSSSRQESGTVYIYNSANPLTQNPVQVIVGSDLTLTQDLTSLRGFGTSLASGVDVDENSFNDLAIGSFLSQQVFLLRTRPLALVSQTLTADPPIVDLEATNCMLGTDSLACFNVTVCATYTGEGVADTIDFTFTVTADANNVERRITFDVVNNPDVVQVMSVNLNGNIMDNCLSLTAYVLDGITDRLNPFIIDFNVEVVDMPIPVGNGDIEPMDFSTIPIASATGINSLSVAPQTNCDGNVCVPDLDIDVDDYRVVFTDGTDMITPTPELTVGAVRNVIVNTDVSNIAEDAFLATITVSAPTRQLEINRLSGALTMMNGQPTDGNLVSLSCPQDQIVNEVVDSVDITRVTCSIGNPLRGPGFTLRVSTTLIPRPDLVGDEGDIRIDFSVQTVNEEVFGNNMDFGSVAIRAMADVFVDPEGIVIPEQISYSNNATDNMIQNVTQLGPSFITSFVVRNSGPSTVRDISVVINWPLQTTAGGNDTFFLYPAAVSSAGSGATVTCLNVNINPANLGLDDLDSLVDDQLGQDPGSGGKKKRRKRRSASLRSEGGKRVLKRQSDLTVTSTTEERTVTCESDAVTCVPIECAIRGLQGGNNVRIDITGFLDERSFADNNDRFTIIPTAQVAIVDTSFLQQSMPDSGKTARAIVRVIPAMAPMPGSTSSSVEWWVIVLAILAAVIVIAVIFGALWGLGFFKRRRHEELKQRKEELENLEKNGSGPGASSTDNLTDGTNM